MTSEIFMPLSGVNPTVDELGGKAFNLWKLVAAGEAVPRWIAVRASAGLPGNAVLVAALDEAGMRGEAFAVRSSAVGEDGGNRSFAGQLDSFLFVPRSGLAAAGGKVRLSARNGRTAAYCRENGFAGDLNTAVIVQEMVDAAKSGVAFALDMSSGSRRGVTISAVRGVGEKLVSGEVDGDTCYVDAAGSLRRASGCESVLTDAEIAEIASAVRRISENFGRIQDIEWAYDRTGKLWILQARPVTALGRIADPDGLEVLWDNSNIAESYPGVTGPLTFSFIRGVYSEVYRQFCRVMGVEPEVIADNRGAFEMLGLIDGRVYYNLLNWYKLLMMLPGYDVNARFMEQMMGVKEPLRVRPEIIIRKRRWKYRRLAAMASGIAVNFLRLDGMVARFHRHFDCTVAPLERSGLSGLEPHELIGLYQRLEDELFKAWRAPLINDFFAMIYYGILKKLMDKWCIGGDGLHNELLTGVGGIVSTEPVARLRRLANLAIAEPGLAAALESGTGLDAFPEFYSEFTEYVDKFGDRCIGELKLETVTYRENPELLIDILRCYVAAGKSDAEADRRREEAVRRRAEETLRHELKGHFMRRIICRHVLKNARKLVRNRENLRFERTRLFAVTRKIFLAVGDYFQREGILSDRRDIFYLTVDEIFNYIRGTGGQSGPAELALLRKTEFAAYAGASPAGRFATRGAVYHGNSFKADKPAGHPTGSPGRLSGVGCSGGVAKGRVKIVSGPSDAAGLNGCIMAAERTDPGWAPLFPVCKGVLVEHGSILSHAAIVTRELGIPSVVGVRGLTGALKDGDYVELDGNSGEIRLLAPEDMEGACAEK